MGYDITIGELKVDKYPEEALEGSGLFFTAKSETHKDAPAFGEPTDYTNSRWPSYSAWSNFADYVGLTDVLFDYRGNLVGGNPGVRLLTPEILAKITAAKARMEALSPPPQPTMENYTEKNGHYCRLIWLEYWCKWALDNCEVPVIANS